MSSFAGGRGEFLHSCKTVKGGGGGGVNIFPTCLGAKQQGSQGGGGFPQSCLISPCMLGPAGAEQQGGEQVQQAEAAGQGSDSGSQQGAGQPQGRERRVSTGRVTAGMCGGVLAASPGSHAGFISPLTFEYQVLVRR